MTVTVELATPFGASMGGPELKTIIGRSATIVGTHDRQADSVTMPERPPRLVRKILDDVDSPGTTVRDARVGEMLKSGAVVLTKTWRIQESDAAPLDA